MRKLVIFFAPFLSALPMAGLAIRVCQARQEAGKVVTDENGVRRLGPAWLTRHDGIYVLYLEGSPFETARQHGALLRDAIGQPSSNTRLS